MALVIRVYDLLESRWHRDVTHRRLVDLLLALFLGSLALIELRRQGWLPPWLLTLVPRTHFHAIQWTFEALLYIEAIGLVFGLSRSVANTLGKQFEILALILIRQAFELFVYFEEPVRWEDISDAITPFVYDGLGGLVIFGLLGVYYRAQRHQRVARGDFDQASFIRTKKLIALALLVGFAAIVGEAIYARFTPREEIDIFGTFYTMLIFGDVLLVLVSMRYTMRYRIIFRNFSFALSTVLIRLALVAPPGFDALIGAGGLLYALVVTVIYNAFSADGDPLEPEQEQESQAPAAPKTKTGTQPAAFGAARGRRATS